MKEEEVVNSIRNRGKRTKLEILETGKELCMVRDSESYKDWGYSSMKEFLDSNDFGFSRSHASNFMRIFDKFGYLLSGDGVQELESFTLTKLLQETYVTDRDIRESITLEVKPDIQKVEKDAKRISQRLDSDLEVKQDSLELKADRQGDLILNQLDSRDKVNEYLSNMITNWLNIVIKYPENDKLQGKRMEIMKRWK